MEILWQEEVSWRQKSNAKSIREGDNNTKKINYILMLKEKGQIITDPER